MGRFAEPFPKLLVVQQLLDSTRPFVLTLGVESIDTFTHDLAVGGRGRHHWGDAARHVKYRLQPALALCQRVLSVNWVQPNAHFGQRLLLDRETPPADLRIQCWRDGGRGS